MKKIKVDVVLSFDPILLLYEQSGVYGGAISLY